MLPLLLLSFTADSFGCKSFGSLLPLPFAGSLRMETVVVFEGGLLTLCFPVVVSLKRREKPSNACDIDAFGSNADLTDL